MVGCSSSRHADTTSTAPEPARLIRASVAQGIEHQFPVLRAAGSNPVGGALCFLAAPPLLRRSTRSARRARSPRSTLPPPHRDPARPSTPARAPHRQRRTQRRRIRAKPDPDRRLVHPPLHPRPRPPPRQLDPRLVRPDQAHRRHRQPTRRLLHRHPVAAHRLNRLGLVEGEFSRQRLLPGGDLTVVRVLHLDRGEITDRGVQSVLVEPVHPAQRRAPARRRCGTGRRS